MSKKATKKKTSPKLGRPSDYTEELAALICFSISTSSKGLRSICKDIGIHPSTIFDWLNKHKSFAEQYARAKQEQADMMVDEIQEVADEAMKLSKKGMSSFRLGGMTAAFRLKIDALKWTASKLKPKQYGDKIDVTSDDKPIKMNVLWLGGKKPVSSSD